MSILFSGYYGHDNMGDDAFGLVSVWASKEFWGESNTSLLSSSGPINEKISMKYILPKKQKIKGEILFIAISKLLQTKFLILAGGSILNQQVSMISLNGLIYLLSKLKILKVGAIGVSLGPFKSNNDYLYIKKQLKNFEFLVLRDKKSYDIAISMKLPYKPILGADLAFLLPKISNIETFIPETSKKIIGISICHYERYVEGNIKNEKRREELFIETLKELIKEPNIELRFFIINGNDVFGDKEITLNIIKILELDRNDYKLINYSADTIHMLEQLSKCNVIFTTRLHGAIFSASLNKPSLLVEYHSKCTDYLDDIGIKEEWRIGDMEINPKIIKNKLLLIINTKQDEFYPKRNVLQELAIKNFTEIKFGDLK